MQKKTGLRLQTSGSEKVSVRSANIYKKKYSRTTNKVTKTFTNSNQTFQMLTTCDVFMKTCGVFIKIIAK